LRVLSLAAASPMHDPARVSRYVSTFREALPGVPFLGLITEPTRAEADVLVVLVATGGTEHIVLGTAKLSGVRYVLLVYHDSDNSLPAVLEVAPALKDLCEVGLVPLSSVGAEARPLLRASEALSRIRGGSVLVIGKPSPWLVYSSGAEERVTSRLGVKLEFLELSALYEELRKVGYTEVSEECSELASRASEVLVDEDSLLKACKLSVAMRRLASELGAVAVSVRCFDIIKDLGVSGCVALSRLLDRGVVAGCEADVPSTVTMLILSALSGKPSWVANVVNVGSSSVELAHCTIATSLTSRYSLVTHFESGLPVAVAGVLEEGVEVTLAKYDPKRDLLKASRGTVRSGRPTHPYRCRTQVAVEVPPGFARSLLEDPLGAHLVLGMGNLLDELRYLATLASMRTEIFR